MYQAREEVINRIIDKYLGSITLARQAYMSDAEYHAQVCRTRDIMEIFDLAMEQEGIAARSRLSVLERVFAGASDATEVHKRIKHMERLKDGIMKAPLSYDWAPPYEPS